MSSFPALKLRSDSPISQGSVPNEAWRVHRSNQSQFIPEERSLCLPWEGCWGHPAPRPACPKAGLDDCPGSRQEHYSSDSHCASPGYPRLSSRTHCHPDTSPSQTVLPPPCQPGPTHSEWESWLQTRWYHRASSLGSDLSQRRI